MAKLVDSLDPSRLPREKLLRLGPSALSDAELLALLLGFGTKGKNVLELSDDLLRRIGGPMGLYGLTLLDLNPVKGIGRGKACALLALSELSLRAGRAHYEKPPFLVALGELEKEVGAVEEAFVFLLDGWGRVIGRGLVGKGTAAKVEPSLHEVLRYVLSKGVSRFALVHTHPFGSALPSKQDLLAAKLLAEKAKEVGVALYDQAVVSKTGYFSFRENKILV